MSATRSRKAFGLLLGVATLAGAVLAQPLAASADSYSSELWQQRLEASRTAPQVNAPLVRFAPVTGTHDIQTAPNSVGPNSFCHDVIARPGAHDQADISYCNSIR